MKKKVSFLLACLAIAIQPVVHAEAPVQGTMQAFVVESLKGKEVLKTAGKVEPRQLVEYQLTYVNKSSNGVSGLTVTGPVPEGTTYVSDTATADVTAKFKVSVDGGSTFEEEPVVREIVKDNGEILEQIVPVDQYTHIQWKSDAELAGKGGVQNYKYRVRVR